LHSKRVRKGGAQMRVIVTGTRELEFSEPFHSRGVAAAGKVAKRMQERLGRELKGSELGEALRMGQTVAAKAAREEVFRVLDALHADTPVTLVVHGGAQGPDRYAGMWAVENGVDEQVYKPRWKRDGVVDRGAGFKRNWYMLFDQAGEQVSTAFDRKTGVVARAQSRIDRLVERAKKRGLMHHLPKLIGMREPLLDPKHPERRAVLQRIGCPLPEDVVVVAFHDGESRGTAHAIMAASVLGYEVRKPGDREHGGNYPHWKAVEIVGDRAKIDHRPGGNDGELGSMPLTTLL